jgi:hypothetical protein
LKFVIKQKEKTSAGFSEMAALLFLKGMRLG